MRSLAALNAQSQCLKRVYLAGSNFARHPLYCSSSLAERVLSELFFDGCGQSSPGCAYQTPSSLGRQQLSKKTNSPSYYFGAQNPNDASLAKGNTTGPGVYEFETCLGKQSRSQKLSQPNWKFGTSQRWSQYDKTFKNQYTTPSAGSAK